MRPLVRNIAITILVLFALTAIFSLLGSAASRKEEISLSALIEEIRNENVAHIIVSGNNLEIELQDGTEKKSRKEQEAGLSETLAALGVTPEELAGVDIEQKNESGFLFWVGALLPILLPLLIIGFFFWLLINRAQQGTMQAFSFGRSKARLFEAKDPKERITFKDAAGVEEAKEELEEIVEFLKSPKKFLDIGARIPRGVLLMGAPGTGKTLLARAVAGEANVPFYHISGSEFVEMFVGVGASRVRDLFETAKHNAPAIVFIDEIDAVGRQRGAGVGGGHDEREQTLNQILVEMDGFDRDTKIIVIAATNRPDILDPALLRPGRFDRRIIIDLPDIKSREAILKLHTKGKHIEATVNLRTVAERTPGFSGADLANLLNEAAIMAARQNKKEVTQLELLESIEKVLLGPERKSHVISKREKEITAYHEAGHALVAASLPHSDPVQKVSVISRGAAAGYTIKTPTEDRRLHSRSEFLDDLATLMGGYESEKLVFRELTTGAANDLQKASELARKLVREYGMSEALGPVTYIDHEEMIFLGRELAGGQRFSESISAKIDQEVTRFINNAQRTAREIIRKKRALLDRIAKRLIEKETIEREEFERLLKITPRNQKRLAPQPA